MQAKKEIKKNPHKNHRERVKTKYLKYGLECFDDHQVMELVLYYSVAQKDTNVMAHDLINKFGSLRGVLEATPEELCEVDGVGMHSAVLLGLIRDINRRCILSDTRTSEVFDTVSKIGEYLLAYFSGLTNERVCIMLLDNSMRLIECVNLADGSVNGAQVDYRLIAQTALAKRAASVVLAHNHPGGLAVPSREDREVTRAVEAALSVVGVNLLEHIVVGTNNFLPTMLGKYSYVRATPIDNKMPEDFYGTFYDV
ncbi:MAG: hypothetical protein IJW65_05200 [Clostridia bacterium]|nr:hypothetical protein [Clostridia bacterium]